MDELVQIADMAQGMRIVPRARDSCGRVADAMMRPPVTTVASLQILPPFFLFFKIKKHKKLYFCQIWELQNYDIRVS